MGNPTAVKQNLIRKSTFSGRTAFFKFKIESVTNLSLSDEVLFQNIDLFRAQDVMGQLVSSFGRETTIDIEPRSSTYGLCF